MLLQIIYASKKHQNIQFPDERSQQFPWKGLTPVPESHPFNATNLNDATPMNAPSPPHPHPPQRKPSLRLCPKSASRIGHCRVALPAVNRVFRHPSRHKQPTLRSVRRLFDRAVDWFFQVAGSRVRRRADRLNDALSHTQSTSLPSEPGPPRPRVYRPQSAPVHQLLPRWCDSRCLSSRPPFYYTLHTHLKPRQKKRRQINSVSVYFVRSKIWQIRCQNKT